MRILKFYAQWCAPCKKLAKDFENENLRVESIDIEQEADMVDEYGIRSVPTTIILDENDKEIKRWVGTFNVKEIHNYLK